MPPAGSCTCILLALLSYFWGSRSLRQRIHTWLVVLWAIRLVAAVGTWPAVIVWLNNKQPYSHCSIKDKVAEGKASVPFKKSLAKYICLQAWSLPLHSQAMAQPRFTGDCTPTSTEILSLMDAARQALLFKLIIPSSKIENIVLCDTILWHTTMWPRAMRLVAA